MPLVSLFASYYAIAQHLWDFQRLVNGVMILLEKEHESEGLGLSNWEILKIYVFKNSIIWALAFSWCFIYIIRTGINDWGNLYLTETHGY